MGGVDYFVLIQEVRVLSIYRRIIYFCSSLLPLPRFEPQTSYQVAKASKDALSCLATEPTARLAVSQHHQFFLEDSRNI